MINPASPLKGWALSRTALFGLAIVAMAPATSTPASAGLLDILFGRREAPRQNYYAQPDRYYAPMAAEPTRRVARPEQKAKPKARPQTRLASTDKPVAARPIVVAGPLGSFLHDPTLRRGDVVVTTEGLKIFTGTSNAQHAANDFTALAEAKGFVAGNSSVLASIDRANRFASQPLEDVQTLPAAPPRPVTALPGAKPDKQAALDASRAR